MSGVNNIGVDRVNRADRVQMHNNPVNFKGKVLPTEELNLAKKFASAKDADRFEQLVKRIEKSNDKKIYKLSQLRLTSTPEINNYLILYCRNRDTYKLNQNLISHKVIPAEEKNISDESIYAGVLKTINGILGRKYSKD